MTTSNLLGAFILLVARYPFSSAIASWFLRAKIRLSCDVHVIDATPTPQLHKSSTTKVSD